jgi:hypothetical protein
MILLRMLRRLSSLLLRCCTWSRTAAAMPGTRTAKSPLARKEIMTRTGIVLRSRYSVDWMRPDAIEETDRHHRLTASPATANPPSARLGPLRQATASVRG